MKTKIEEKIEIPEGIICELADNVLKCKKDSIELSIEPDLIGIQLKIQDKNIIFSTVKGSKKDLKIIKANLSHIKNIFRGLEDKFEYKLEIANVHFPMTAKVEGNRLAINNFLGEKNPRYAEILPNVDVEIKGQEITVSSPDRKLAGQTAANFEKATQIKGRDKRIFQDGIYITQKPERREK